MPKEIPCPIRNSIAACPELDLPEPAQFRCFGHINRSEFAPPPGNSGWTSAVAGIGAYPAGVCWTSVATTIFCELAADAAAGTSNRLHSRDHVSGARSQRRAARPRRLHRSPQPFASRQRRNQDRTTSAHRIGPGEGARRVSALHEKKPEQGGSLLDNTVTLFGSNLGNANSHDTENLPILLAGGGYRHGKHIRLDSKHNTPLSNLFVDMLQTIGIETNQFGSSTAASVNGFGT